MKTSLVIDKLERGELILAAKVNFMSPRIVEMMGYLGYDCIWICNEHLSADESIIDHMILAARAWGMDSMIRRNMSGYEDLLRPLEMGVTGLLIPRTKNPEYVQRIVQSVKFPPLGRRGCDGVNVDADFGFLPLPEYLRRANEQTFVAVQIEDPEAVEAADDIALIDGVNILFVGPGDLSVQLGIPGKLHHPMIMNAFERVARACRRHGKCAGTIALCPADTAKLVDLGFRFFTTNADYQFVKKGLLSLREEYSQLGFTFRK